MKIIEPSVIILTPIDGNEILKFIERCGRVCYKSEDLITENSAKEFVKKIIKSGHEAVLEHFNITIQFTCDRGVSHEIVRHRLASYCQESTRYCDYSKDKFNNEVTFIKPPFFEEGSFLYNLWKVACSNAEDIYLTMKDNGATPQEARSVLPNSLKTEVVMTANLREWRHFFKLRTSKAAHPQMREVANLALMTLKNEIPIIFDDIEVEK